MTFAALLSFLRKVPGWVYLAVFAAGAIWWWGNTRYDAGRDDERDVQERLTVEAVMKAVKAEREAQAKFTEREQERETTTRDLREAAAKAEPGQKTRAVLDALRGQGTARQGER